MFRHKRLIATRRCDNAYAVWRTICTRVERVDYIVNYCWLPCVCVMSCKTNAPFLDFRFSTCIVSLHYESAVVGHASCSIKGIESQGLTTEESKEERAYVLPAIRSKMASFTSFWHWRHLFNSQVSGSLNGLSPKSAKRHSLKQALMLALAYSCQRKAQVSEKPKFLKHAYEFSSRTTPPFLMHFLACVSMSGIRMST